MKRMRLLIMILILAVSVSSRAQQTFTNPLLPSGADPWCIYQNGFYYYTNTLGNRIDIWKTKSIAGIKNAERKTVWTPPAKGPYSKEIWAPEIHFLKDKWYIYFAADSGRNNGHRLWVLENSAADPMQGEWVIKGKLETPQDKWSIDGSVFEYRKQLYLIWSGWEGNTNGQQNIYIARMKNPWTVKNKRTLVSAPTYAWEKNGKLNNPNDVSLVYVNEGPEVLVHNNKLFLIYSASGCWTDMYALGILEAKGTNLMNAGTWKKYPEPVFTRSVDRKVFAPGHNSFFKSPDGKEDWILYHANDESGQGCGRFRSPRAQKFSWTSDGKPFFGEPVAINTALQVPSGTPVETASVAVIKGDFAIKNVSTGMLLRPRDASRRDATPIVGYGPVNWKCMTWDFKQVDNNTYLLHNLLTGKTFQPVKGLVADGAHLEQQPVDQQNAQQQWEFLPAGNQTFLIKLKNTEYFLTGVDEDILLAKKRPDKSQLWTIYEQHPTM